MCPPPGAAVTRCGCVPIPGLHAGLDLHDLVRDVDHADGNLPGLRMALPLQIVVHPHLQEGAQLGGRQPCSAHTEHRLTLLLVDSAMQRVTFKK